MLPKSKRLPVEERQLVRAYPEGSENTRMLLRVRWGALPGQPSVLEWDIELQERSASGVWAEARNLDGVKELSATSGKRSQDVMLRAVWPELVELIEFRGVGDDGPLHYIDNTVYLAGTRDCWGTEKGEQRRTQGDEGKLLWRYEKPPRVFPVASDEEPPELRIKAVPLLGTGKERDLEGARRAAMWPEATDEELCKPREELTDLLKARLPGLMTRVCALVKNLGFTY